MRDMRKVKGKHIFELDNKQMIFVFAGLVIICLFVFTAGVMVGSRSTRNKIVTAEAKNDFRAKIKAPALLEEKKAEKAEPAPKTIEEVLEPVAMTEEKPAAAGKEIVAASRKEPEKAAKPAEEAKKEAEEKQEREAWFVQVAAFQERSDAEKRAKQLTDKKYKAVIVKADIPGKGTWHRVRLGPYDTSDQAKAASLDFMKKEKVTTFVTKGLTR